MKQPQNVRKQRPRTSPRKPGARNNNSGSNGNPGNRSENRSRGNPKQALEKYKNQAREALQAGDRVTAEYYFQYADHYQRLVNEQGGYREPEPEADDDEQSQDRGQRGRGRRNNNNNRHQRHDDQGNGSANIASNSQDQKPATPVVTPPEVPDAVEVQPQEIEAHAPKKPRGRPRVKKPDLVANSEQPVEVHPELDLGAAAAAAAEKPKRRIPVRRKRPESADTTSDTAPKGGAA